MENKTGTKLKKEYKQLFAIVIIQLVLMILIFWRGFDYARISRENAEVYKGSFESYEIREHSDGIIYFEDGSIFYIYGDDASEKMEKLPAGTKLELLINPRNGYVMEIKNGNDLLMDFDITNEAFDDIFLCYLGLIVLVIFLAYILAMIVLKKLKQNRSEPKLTQTGELEESKIIRKADLTVKSRTLLECQYMEYSILYRRQNHTNELIVNGNVYDEYQKRIEFEHTLRAVIDGHLIEAGLDDQSRSFISVDGVKLKTNVRIY